MLAHYYFSSYLTPNAYLAVVGEQTVSNFWINIDAKHSIIVKINFSFCVRQIWLNTYLSKVVRKFTSLIILNKKKLGATSSKRKECKRCKYDFMKSTEIWAPLNRKCRFEKFCVYVGTRWTWTNSLNDKCVHRKFHCNKNTNSEKFSVRIECRGRKYCWSGHFDILCFQHTTVLIGNTNIL